MTVCHAELVDVTLRYFDGCPSWQTMETRVRAVLDADGRTDTVLRHEKIQTPEDAERLAFVGSPTLLVDGQDPFLAPGATVGLACRVYKTPAGLAGSPTWEQLQEVLR